MSEPPSARSRTWWTHSTAATEPAVAAAAAWSSCSPRAHSRIGSPRCSRRRPDQAAAPGVARRPRTGLRIALSPSLDAGVFHPELLVSRRGMAVNRAEVERRMAQRKALARSRGVKLTHQRLEIFCEVASRTDHPAVGAVFRAVQGAHPHRFPGHGVPNAWVLEELGLLSTLGPRHGAVRFSANLRRHHQYACTRCGLTRGVREFRVRCSQELEQRHVLRPGRRDTSRAEGRWPEVLGSAGRAARAHAQEDRARRTRRAG